MASGSSSPSSDISSEISESDSPIYGINFSHLKLVIGLPSPAAGVRYFTDEDDESSYEETGAVVSNELKMCVGRRNNGVSWAIFADQSFREHMEDRHTIVPEFLSLRYNNFGGCTARQCEYALTESSVRFIAVFDGDGGSQVSDYCAVTLHKVLKEAWDTKSRTNQLNQRWETAMSKAYENVDKACEKTEAGSTALVVLLSFCQIIAANCGDSRAIRCRRSHTIPLTMDHKPEREDQEDRISKSGGSVLSDALGVLRVDGVLAMSRAIGDKALKPSVSWVPELTFTTRSEEDECLIIATDGLWDVMSTEVVGNLASELLQQGRQAARFDKSPTQHVAECLLKEARSRSSTDNFCVIVVDLKSTRILKLLFNSWI